MLEAEFKRVVLRSLALLLARAPINAASSLVTALQRDVDRLLALLK